MRVVAGERKGLRLKAAPGNTTRPTTDKVKESLFNIIGPFFDGGTVLDLFAGSGGLGIETLSRGADNGVFIEKDRKAYAVLKENIEKCHYEERAEVYCNDAIRAVKALLKRDITFDYLFVDPPYAKMDYYNLVEVLVENGKVSNSAIIICEHAKEVKLPTSYSDFSLQRQELYGSSYISIYRKVEEEGEETCQKK